MSDREINMKDAPIVAVVEASGVELMPYGEGGISFWACCPFCEEAKFFVGSRINKFFCFACRVGGGPEEYAKRISDHDIANDMAN